MNPTTAPGSQASLREMNRARVVEALRDNGALTQVEIATITGLSAASVSNLVKELNSSQSVDLTPAVRNGRRATLVTLNAGAGILAGLVFAEREVRAVIAADPDTVIASRRMPLPAGHVADEGIERGGRLLSDLLEQAGHEPGELLAATVGVSAPLGLDGRIGSDGVMPGWAGVDLCASFGDLLGVDVDAWNTADLAALGELRRGALQGVSSGMFIRMSHGVGAGLILGGEVYRGPGGIAGELGHITVDPGGDICRCGNRGCLETLIGSRAILGSLAASHGPLQMHDVAHLARDGDPGCRRVLADAGNHLGVVVAGQAGLLGLQCVVLGGRLGQAGDIITAPLREAIMRCALPSVADTVKVAASTLGTSAEVTGALVAAGDLRARRSPLGAI